MHRKRLSGTAGMRGGRGSGAQRVPLGEMGFLDRDATEKTCKEKWLGREEGERLGRLMRGGGNERKGPG